MIDMFFGNLEEYEVENLGDEDISLSPDDLLNKESKVLADIVVSYRYLNVFPELANKSMQLLAERRVSGEIFNYEEYIENKLKELPNLNTVNVDIASVLKKVKI